MKPHKILKIAIGFLGIVIATGTYSADREIKSSLSNILFLIIDDVGMDQMTSFGYGGITAAAMPNIDKIAKAGIRFRNNWTMPACSPSRAVFLKGDFLCVTIYLAHSDLKI